MAGESFTLDIDRFVKAAKGNLDLVVRKIALDLFRRVIMKSPVATGRFKGNWQVAIGAALPSGTAELFDKSPLGDVGTIAITKVDAAILGVKAGDIITLVNNLSYSNKLEYGYSKQAPAGMVRLSAMEYGAVVTKAANEVPK